MTVADEVLAKHWDDIVVGAGSSGSVLAARLSANPDRRVLLLEAGPDRAAGPAGVPLGTPVLTGANWSYMAAVGRSAASRSYPYPVARVVGGSSAVNGAIALRGLPVDFDGWAAAGNPAWAWPQVLPWLRRLEHDHDFSGPLHGDTGPVPIRRPAASEISPWAGAFTESCHGLGIPDLPDLNGTSCAAEAAPDSRDPVPGVGVGPVPSNAVDGVRVSSADSYLEPARGRVNLVVAGGCLVNRVLVRAGRAIGVEVLWAGQLYRVSGQRVTLCAGAINTPTILQRSAIGSAVRSAALDLDPVADLPGVGQNLIDHAMAQLWAIPRDGVCAPGDAWHQVLARVAAIGPVPDLNLLLVGNVRNSAIPGIGALLGSRPGLSIGSLLLAPASRGKVLVHDRDPLAPPTIVLNLAVEEADVLRLMAGIRLAWEIATSDRFGPLLQRVLIWTARMVHDDALLRRAVTNFVIPTWHPAGTARMGPAADPEAVVDEQCRVHTIEQLRVVDASVMPTIPRAPTNLTCMMLAERVAGWMA